MSSRQGGKQPLALERTRDHPLQRFETNTGVSVLRSKAKLEIFGFENTRENLRGHLCRRELRGALYLLWTIASIKN